MRLLIVNGNTTEAVTQTVMEVARAAAAPDTQISGVTASFGAAFITSRSEAAIAEHATLAALAEHYQDFDAALIAVSLDTGLRAARAALPIPVVGMTEAALYTACMLGGQFGLVTFNHHCTSLYRERVEINGLLGRLAGIHTIDADFAKVYSESKAYETRIIEGAHALIHGQGAEVIVLCGAQTAGVTGRIQDRVPVPMLDGVVCGTLQAEAMARLRAAKPTTGSYSALTSAQLSSISPGLKSLLGRGRS